MILSDRHIKEFLKEGRIKITPKPKLDVQLGPCSIDFHLGNIFRIFDHSKYPYIDPQKSDLSKGLMKEIVVKNGEAFIMRPGEFILATVVEELVLPDDLIGRLEGRSSLGRLGIIVHSTAARFDPGWIGKPVMELGNIGVMPVALYPGMRICSFTFEEVSSAVDSSYVKKGKYAHQSAPDTSRLSEEFGKPKKRNKKRKII